MQNIPIYIISYNRLNVLKETIQSFLPFVDYSDLIIIDNTSDYQPLLDYYQTLKDRGTKIFYNQKLEHANDLNSVSKFIDPENKRRQCKYYVVTDPDISLKGVNKDFFKICRYFLDNYPEVNIVGPMLKIIDIPEEYPAREFVWKRHVDQFWHKEPSQEIIFGKTVYFQPAKIDTTFGMLRAEKTYTRLLTGVRLYAPYEALHLDWYITPKSMTKDQQDYSKKMGNNKISHWSGQYFTNAPKDALSKDERTIYVVENDKIQTHRLFNPYSLSNKVKQALSKLKDTLT
ncbi:hypothetical protein RCC89_16295 [Cytophagaceae bacterium ABcell3]|nr:hypothetical protein RCC89_16295 [Cytophagaceae bacterium ABcell3]